jgi:hypothetical protein
MHADRKFIFLFLVLFFRLFGEVADAEDGKLCENYGKHASCWDSRGEHIGWQLLPSLVFVL